MGIGLDLAGEWVADQDMHPLINIAGREWMTADSEMRGTFYGLPDPRPQAAKGRGLYWRFPAENERTTNGELRNMAGTTLPRRLWLWLTR